MTTTTTGNADREEVWLPVVGFEGCYEITATGRVRSVDRRIAKVNRWGVRVNFRQPGVELRPHKTSRGRLQVVLHDLRHRRHCRSLASLVADTFGEET